MLLFMATDSGLVGGRFENGSWEELNHTLPDHKVTSVIAREGVILAGTTTGVYRSDDGGLEWRPMNEGLSIAHVRWLAYHPAVSDLEFAGTEPAGIFVSGDGAESWQERPEVSQLRDEHEWFLPYSPEAGCVRGFAFHGRRIYAAVEVGGLLISDDQGQSWHLAAGSDGVPEFGPPQPGFIHPDVHSVVVHPTSAELVYAPTGGGFYISKDGGQSWKMGYDDCYVRAVWVDPADANHLVLGPAGSVDRNGRIEETKDGGRTWATIHEGLDAPWPRHMVERFVQVDNYLLAVLSNGHLLAAVIGDWKWQRIFSSTDRIHCVSQMG